MRRSELREKSYKWVYKLRSEFIIIKIIEKPEKKFKKKTIKINRKKKTDTKKKKLFFIYFYLSVAILCTHYKQQMV